jgi:type II secretory pathway pseudopilin PulG
MKYCPNCGQPALDSHRFCMLCGADVSSAPVVEAQYAQQQAAQNPYPAQPQYYAVQPVAKGSNTAVIAIVLAVGAVVLIPVVLIIAAIAIPNLLRARIAANESSAVGSVRTLNTALVSYQAQYGHFPETMGALASNGNTTPSETGAMLIDEVLAKGEKSGYRFAYEHGAPSAGQTEGYTVTATPLVQNSSGVRNFFSDETGVIRCARSAPADKESPPL